METRTHTKGIADVSSRKAEAIEGTLKEIAGEGGDAWRRGGGVMTGWAVVA